MTGVLPLPRWTLIVHAIMILVSVIVLGLSAYGVHYISYNALIFALVTAILTMGISAYVICSTLFLQNLYNGFVVLGLHILMVIFWVTELGLVANLARIWSSSYGYSYSYGYDYDWDWSYKRSLGKRAEEGTTYEAYRGALIAGALFGAVNFVLWIVSTVFVIIYLNKSRSHAGTTTAPHAPTGGAPTYGGNQAIPVEQKYDQSVPAPQQHYTQQPVYGQQQQQQQQPYGQYPQDPVHREQTISPVSQGGYAAAPHSELGNNQPYNPNVSELSYTK